ncbi:alpha/beta fold hydrolase, partial [Micromonospora zhanjiangensis]
PGFAAARPELVGHYRDMLTATPAAGYAGCCEAIAALDLRADLALIAAPTLVVAGADDPAIPVDHAERITAGIPGARLVVVDQAAHLANVEQPEAVAELVREHVDRE